MRRPGLSVRALTDVGSLKVDLVGLGVDRVRVDGGRARFRQRSRHVDITLPAKQAAGAEFLVEIRYSGTPEPVMGTWGDVGWEELEDGSLVAGQPNGSATWYPVNDHPAHKATYRISVLTDADYSVIANGRLTGKSRASRGTRWEWTSDTPLAPYLASVQIGRYRIDDLPGDEGDGTVPQWLAAPRLTWHAAALVLEEAAADARRLRGLVRALPVRLLRRRRHARGSRDPPRVPAVTPSWAPTTCCPPGRRRGWSPTSCRTSGSAIPCRSAAGATSG